MNNHTENDMTPEELQKWEAKVQAAMRFLRCVNRCLEPETARATSILMKEVERKRREG